ncbi:bifunctional precorrin-2 dehydrogenase/sirohydrochlorin ferrochelatase [Petralouisia muris]|jgi:precorrin-2 dehydrogenase/sirohydrochlorin ferrochelatase|uniref:Bifunctional precorrin-2 dehydrogenase/sirohydrochlorin ferrochelatase n=1 Tax=Petralouisia muris TaxID=3032872 RepID=A0AC61RVI1_9FIRM|nr:bifunctional precorrin-2 dehydrogenase/sirohydrochlorin ferrochelatase [Petralouisia muris]TGY95874.1 bifunctional precorrin-2 dehydrogenase/sirohydrochlorin ferrochelatase [Petralouisia muris]
MGAYFPLFINMEGKRVQVFGGGKIAARRVLTLLEFGARVKVTAPMISKELEKLAEQENSLTLEYRRYQRGELKEVDLVLAATCEDKVNDMIFMECRQKEIPVNVASDQEKCDFYFPGVAKEGEITVGVTAGGKNHKKAKKVTERIRELLKEIC